MPLLGVKEDWSLKITAEELISRAKEEIEKSKKAFDTIVAVHDMKVSYDNVLKVQADLQAVFLSAQYYIEFPQHVSTDPDLREASAQAEKLIKEYLIESSMRRDVFRKLQIANNRGLRLRPEAQRYLWRSLKLGKRNGLLRSEDDQEQLKTIQKRICDLVIQYWKNLNEKESTLEFSDKELDGMPADFIENLEKNPETEKYIVTLKYPDYIPIMEKCKVPETRRQLEFAFNSQCIEENHPLLDEIVKLRHKAANIMGYPNHATFVSEILMSGGPTIVRSFLWELKDALAPLWEEEKKILLELKEKECKELSIPFDGELKPYDLGYYTNIVKETRYNVDHTKLKEYFPMNIVIKRVQNMYQKLLGLEFEEMNDADVWHKDVKVYGVRDSASSELFGYYFLDLFPRPGKYSHACLLEMQPGCLLADGSRQLAVAAMLANFSQSKTDKPTLMSHDEVITFFHEFGHIMHFVCARADYAMFSGINVERDFIETPSQIMENWCWEPEALSLLSSHYLDKSVIPDGLMANLIKSRLANTAYTNLRQIVLALYDFTIHSSNKKDVKQTYFDLSNEILGISPTEGTHFGCIFRHTTKDYDCQYYSYLWSEVFSMDVFEMGFKKGNNILNPKNGMIYRQKLLQPGGTKDACDMLIDFLGRHPTQDAFLRNKGLQTPPKSMRFF